MTVTPEANIRFDLLILFPLIFLLTIWYSFKAFR